MKRGIGRGSPIGQNERTLLIQYYAPNANKNALLVQMLNAILSRTAPEKGVVRFPFVHAVLGRNYHLNKNERYFFIGEMRREGLIKIIPFHGIKIVEGYP